MKKVELNGTWLCCGSDEKNQPIVCTANVPGCVHTDLIANCIIEPDLFWRNNYEKSQWVENRNFTYSRTFWLESVETHGALVCEGLDTYCDLYLNGRKIGSADNMFIRHSFPVGEFLRIGENTLKIEFRSPMFTKELPRRVGSFSTERLYTRRMQCTYGWDWVERFVTMGIFRDIYILLGNDAVIDHVYLYTAQANAHCAQVVADIALSNYEKGETLEISLQGPDGQIAYQNTVYCCEPLHREYMDVAEPKLWFPNGYGQQPLYTFTVETDGHQVYHEKIGIVTSFIQQKSDEKGSVYDRKCIELKNTVGGAEYDHNEAFSGFQLWVNGVGVMCKGANWVPCEPFPSAETKEKIGTILQMAKDAGMNMIRVWGGGIFEQDFFYDECDRLGLMVTQDFMMACGHYPEEESAFLEALAQEAKYAALRLRNHPCLMWWTGDNENAVLGNDRSKDFWGRTAALKAIFPVLRSYDPQRRFLLSSPWGGDSYASKTVGTTHNTQYLSELLQQVGKIEDYKEYLKELTARFIAEEPCMGAANRSSLLKFMTDGDVLKGDSMWLAHTKTNPALCEELLTYTLRFAEDVLGPVTDGEDRLIKLQYLQYEWIRVTLENARRNKGFCNGILYWMLNDCWPTASGWSIIDYYTCPKAGWYSFRRCAKPLIASVDRQNGQLMVYACNDSLKEETLQMKISLLNLTTGKLRTLVEEPVCCPAENSIVVHTFPASVLADGELLICQLGSFDRAFYKHGNLPIAPVAAPTVVYQASDRITLRADRYIHIVRLEGDCGFSDNYFSLLPGEERTVDISGEGMVSLTAFTVK